MLAARRTLGNVAPFTPKSIAGLIAWYDGSTLGLANGATVNNWPDLSGNGHPLNANPGVNFPTYSTSALNGLGAVNFAGNGNGIATSALNVYTPGLISSQPDTIYVVYKYTTLNGNAIVFNTRQSTNVNAYFQDLSNFLELSAGTGQRFGSPTVAADTARHMVGLFFNGASSNVRLDRTNYTPAGNPGTSFIGDLFMGNDITGLNGMRGLVGEWVAYNSQLTSTQYTQVENYLRGKWGTP